MFPSFAMGAPAFTASPTFTVRLPRRKCAYQAKTFGAISRITLLPPDGDVVRGGDRQILDYNGEDGK